MQIFRYSNNTVQPASQAIQPSQTSSFKSYRALKRPSAEETGRWSLHQQALKAFPPPSHLSFLSATRDTRPGRKERSEERGREARYPERLAAQKEKKATSEETAIGKDRALKRPRPQKTGRLTTCR